MNRFTILAAALIAVALLVAGCSQSQQLQSSTPEIQQPEATPQETTQTLSDVDQLFVNESEVEIGEMI